MPLTVSMDAAMRALHSSDKRDASKFIAEANGEVRELQKLISGIHDEWCGAQWVTKDAAAAKFREQLLNDIDRALERPTGTDCALGSVERTEEKP